MRNDVTFLPVTLGSLELCQVVRCHRLVVERSLPESSGHGIGSLPAKVLHES